MIRCERIGGRAINIVNNLFCKNIICKLFGGCGRFVDKLRPAEECRRLHVLLEQIDEDLEALSHSYIPCMLFPIGFEWFSNCFVHQAAHRHVDMMQTIANTTRGRLTALWQAAALVFFLPILFCVNLIVKLYVRGLTND